MVRNLKPPVEFWPVLCTIYPNSIALQKRRLFEVNKYLIYFIISSASVWAGVFLSVWGPGSVSVDSLLPRLVSHFPHPCSPPRPHSSAALSTSQEGLFPVTFILVFLTAILYRKQKTSNKVSPEEYSIETEGAVTTDIWSDFYTINTIIMWTKIFCWQFFFVGLWVFKDKRWWETDQTARAGSAGRKPSILHSGWDRGPRRKTWCSPILPGGSD